MFCVKCGKEIQDNSRFCPKCGAGLSDDRKIIVPESKVTKGRRYNPVIVNCAAAVLVIIAVAVVALYVRSVSAKKNEPESGNEHLAESGEGEDVNDLRDTDTSSREEIATPDTETDIQDSDISETHMITVTVEAANDTGVLSGAEVRISGVTEENGITDPSGRITFDHLKDGEYYIECSAHGFNSGEQQAFLDGEDLKLTLGMVPEISGDDACVLMRWNGDRNLDLCAFNSDLREYVNIGHPIDSTGNVFLYADHDSDRPYEVIYIHDIGDKAVKTFYVTEGENARAGVASDMERDGVSIYVYDSTGLIYSCSADKNENAALWCPCYIYENKIYDMQEYVYDVTDSQYAWISFDESDAVPVDESVWKREYLLTLNQYYGDGDPDLTHDDCNFHIGYINDDNIPELIIQEDFMTTRVFSYIDKTVFTYSGDACGGFYYISGGNKMLFHCQGGDYSAEFHEIVNLTDRGFELVGNGSVHRSILEFEGSNTLDGLYNWVETKYADMTAYEAYYYNNESFSSRSDYNKAIKRNLDYSKASDYFKTFKSYNELVRYLAS